MKKFTLEEAIADGNFCDDNIDFIENDEVPGAELIEATAQELADMNVGTACGRCPNSAFKSIAKMFPDILVHTTLEHAESQPLTGSCTFLCTSREQAHCIQGLADAGEGSLREEIPDPFPAVPCWVYYETE